MTSKSQSKLDSIGHSVCGIVKAHDSMIRPGRFRKKHNMLAEGVGFEPTVGYQPTTVFKTAALSRSAIPPALSRPLAGGLVSFVSSLDAKCATHVSFRSLIRLCPPTLSDALLPASIEGLSPVCFAMNSCASSFSFFTRIFCQRGWGFPRCNRAWIRSRREWRA